MSTHVLPERCWELSHHAEDASRDEGYPHFATRPDALAVLYEELRDARRDLEPDEKLRDHYPELLGAGPVLNDEPCWVLICDGCGLGMHWEGAAVRAGTHWPNATEALSWAEDDASWSTTASDGWDAYCEPLGAVFHHCAYCAAGSEVAAS